jgi:hypothetical protein
LKWENCGTGFSPLRRCSVIDLITSLILPKLSC